MNHSLHNFATGARSHKSLLLIVGLGAGLRILAIVFLGRQPLVGDAVLYHDFAMRLLQGMSIYPLVPPAEGYYLAFFYRWFGASPLVARLCMLPLAIAFLYALYAVAEKFAGRRSANLVTLVFAVWPLQILCSVEPITETPASLFLLVSLLLVLALLARPRLGAFVLLGFALGALILTRPSALLLLAVVPPFLLYRLRQWLPALVVASIPVLLIALWIVKVYDSTGHFVMINYSSTQNVFLGNSSSTPLYRTWWLSTHEEALADTSASFQALNAEIQSAPWYEQAAIYRRVALESIAARPDLFAVRTANRLRVYFAFDSYTGSLLMNRYHAGRTLAFAAMALDAVLYMLVGVSAILFLFTLSRHSKKFWPTLAILLMLAAYAGPYLLSVSHPIYHYPIVPLMGILGAAWWSDLLEHSRERSNRPATAIRGNFSRQAAMVFAVGLFAYIQVEYAVVMYLYSSH